MFPIWINMFMENNSKIVQKLQFVACFISDMLFPNIKKYVQRLELIFFFISIKFIYRI